ncbi:MAG: NUDIX domain-containing protein [Nesterenkonia sp.]|uniref:NUDIX hydrolase n=1 Tax=Nesterenkonia marinintestina TaxID=2979865 RepID=UPI0021C1AEA3|nr:NUDIX domain-containing protein [Nesterenkonia sp. GX14115]MDO5493886.1 NUDIX domain-containing protein [Nesterenkonia sp.]
MRDDDIHQVHTAGRVIRVVAVVLRDVDDRILTVRKHGTRRFMQPGGKPDPGESIVDAGIRECREELGLELRPHDLRHLGSFCAPAANEEGYMVEAEVLLGIVTVTDPGEPQSEIADVRWVDPRYGLSRDEYAALFLDHFIPALDGAAVHDDEAHR